MAPSRRKKTSASEPLQPDPASAPTADTISNRYRRLPPLQWVLGAGVLLIAIAGGGLALLFRDVQTYKIYDWSIVPTSDYRIEATCNQLTLYYLSWQNPNSDKPAGHQIERVNNQRCVSSALAPTPTNRFKTLKDPIVLSRLGCKADAVSNPTTFSWTCKQPLGKLLQPQTQPTQNP